MGQNGLIEGTHSTLTRNNLLIHRFVYRLGSLLIDLCNGKSCLGFSIGLLETRRCLERTTKRKAPLFSDGGHTHYDKPNPTKHDAYSNRAKTKHIRNVSVVILMVVPCAKGTGAPFYFLRF